MPKTSSRIQREAATIAAMIRLYCARHHPGAPETPCAECRELLGYARLRLARCPFQEGKTTCVRCPVHCYTPAMRQRVREVMRFAGPRMLTRHPVLVLWHWLDSRRKTPVKSSE